MACPIPPLAPVRRTRPSRRVMKRCAGRCRRPLAVHDTRRVPRAEVIALFGPTGVGKTAVAIALGHKLEGLGERPVAVSADALQVYSGLETLTGAATPAERTRLEHRLISFLPVDASFSAGQYAELAHA